MQLAGLVARNVLDAMTAVIPSGILHTVQSLLLHALVDADTVVRSTANNVVCTIARSKGGLEGWRDLFPFLAILLERGDAMYAALCWFRLAMEWERNILCRMCTRCSMVESSLATVANICEDVGDTLDSDSLGRPLNSLVRSRVPGHAVLDDNVAVACAGPQMPILLQYALNPTPVLRRHALRAMLAVHGTVADPPVALLVHIGRYLEARFALGGAWCFPVRCMPATYAMGSYVTFWLSLQVLSALSTDPDAAVRKLVCLTLVSLLDRAGEHMVPALPSVIEYFLQICEREVNGDVLLAACEFWSALCEASVGANDSVRELFISKFDR